ncbi:Thioredoxin-like protein AAED1 [Trichoplax sp. H2]|nr:Thioredoxin-like protein AAED1 [Trichoplax sp. H2]|eukprot:RDD47936.1 Thioredoxin-like protein AAED1 [Trichoplax sp. H2]
MAGVDTNQISAEVTDEKQLEWSKIDGLPVFDENGATLKFGDLYRDQLSIIVFVRYLTTKVDSDDADLAKIPQESLAEANVRLIVIGCGKPNFIKKFRQETGYNHDMYCDPQRTIYSKLGMATTLAHAAPRSEHIKSSELSGLAKSIWRGIKSMRFQGKVTQQGGQLVVGPGNILKYFHTDIGTFDHTPINKLLTVANVANINFTQH